MRRGTIRMERWVSSHTFGTLLAIGVVVLMAATAFGQPKSSPKGKQPRHAAASKNPASEKAQPRKAEPRKMVAIKPGADEQAIRQAFQVTADFDFTEVPLDKVIQRFRELTKQEILIDNKALQDVGIASDTPITFTAQSISAKSAMAIILREVSLTWLIRDNVMMITTPEEADNQLTTRVYPVYDLIAPKPSYRFEGMYVPGMTTGGFPRGSSSGSTPQNVAGMGGGGMMMSGGMGQMGGGMGGAGGGMFSVHDNFQPARINGNAGPVLLAQLNGGKPAKAARGAGGAPAGGGANTAPGNPPSQGGEAAVGGRKGGMGGAGMQMSQSGGDELAFSMDDLVDLVTSTIKPTTWDGVGGPGSIARAAGMLVISQTQEVHEEIESLLANLRVVTPGLRVVNIRAVWLQLDLTQLDQLLHSKPGKEAGIDRKALYHLAGKVKGYIGAITCLSGQTVHIASGRSRTAVTGAVPVVGGGGEGPGYQPVTSQPQAGALLQVTPQLLPNTQGAMLDLCSSVTRAGGKPETVRFYSEDPQATKKGGDTSPRGITLDRVNMVVSQLATTLKVHLDEPTLVGGLTTETPVGEQQAADTPQLYLFIEANAK
jgi:hypothetical protein